MEDWNSADSIVLRGGGATSGRNLGLGEYMGRNRNKIN